MLLVQLLNDNDIYYKTNITENIFTDSKNKRIFLSAKDCILKGVEANIQSVVVNDKTIDAKYISQLSSNFVSSANWLYYYKDALENSRQERLRKLPMLIGDLISQKKDSNDIINDIEVYLADLATNASARKIEKAKDIIYEAIQNIEERFKLKGKLPGIASGMYMTDDILMGFRDRMLYYIGGRPSDGKSALMMNMAAHISIRSKIPCGIISAESGNVELVNRLIASEGHVNSQVLTSGFIKESDMARIHDIGKDIYDSPLYFYDMPSPDLSDVISQARRMVSVYGVKIIFIDYLQIIQYGNSSIPMHERVKYCSLQLKKLARDLNIPIVCLAQLRRDADNRRPQKGDFSDSSQIEKDADGIILIYHKIEKGFGLFVSEKI